jgi:hypothetical protein
MKEFTITSGDCVLGNVQIQSNDYYSKLESNQRKLKLNHAFPGSTQKYGMSCFPPFWNINFS